MDVTMLRQDAEQKFMLPRNMNHSELINDAVDISLLTSLEGATLEGEPGLVVELIDLYFDDVPQKLKAIGEAITLGDLDSLRSAAHSLKGSSGSLGAYKMADLCDELEASANDQTPHGLNTILIRVEHEYERVRLAFWAERQRRLAPKVG